MTRQAVTVDSSIAEHEFPNLKQALITAVEDAEPAYALDLGVALRPYWEAHGTLPDELRLLKQAVANCPNDEPSVHAGLNLLAQLTLTAGDTEQARGYAQRALAEANDEPVLRAAALVSLARVNWKRDQHDDAVMGSLDEALALAATAGVAQVEADALRVDVARSPSLNTRSRKQRATGMGRSVEPTATSSPSSPPPSFVDSGHSGRPATAPDNRVT